MYLMFTILSQFTAVFYQLYSNFRVLVMVVCTALLCLPADAQPSKRVFKFPVERKIDLSRPWTATDRSGRIVAEALYEGLTALSPDTLEVIGGVAKNWTVGADRKSYMFFLRDDARWSSGRKVVAEDFIRAWKDVVSRPEYYPDAHLLIGSLENARSYYANAPIPEGIPLLSVEAPL